MKANDLGSVWYNIDYNLLKDLLERSNFVNNLKGNFCATFQTAMRTNLMEQGVFRGQIFGRSLLQRADVLNDHTAISWRL